MPGLPTHCCHAALSLLHLCLRDYAGSMCPKGFVAAPTQTWSCLPGPGYDGPCGGPANFDGFTARSLAEWSRRCAATWPCLGVVAADLEMEIENAAYPLSLAATSSRLAGM